MTGASACATAGAAQDVPVKPSAESFSGVATVVDGDGLEVNGVKVRLFGIDAPEVYQYCRVDSGASWRCGQYATVALDREIGGKQVTCEPQDKDRYGRVVAVCRIDGRDVGRFQVRRGWAVAYRYFSKDYVEDEEIARREKNGIWAGEFEMPWEYRRRSR
jgi:endonuclease YncB( thermonuclease family)